MIRRLAGALLVGCGPAAGGPDCALEAEHLLLATTDFEVGALAAVDARGCVRDTLASTDTDPLVRALPGGWVAVADRARGDALRLYEAGRYEAPRFEVVVEPEGNLHDVARVGDELWLAPFERPALVRTDLDGNRLGTVDLSAWADEDGLPEVDRVIPGPTRVYVGLQRLIRGGSVWQADEGVIVAVDPDDPDAGPVEVARPGPNPKLAPDPSDPERILALTGRYGSGDGALVVVDPAEGTAVPLVSEADLGFDLSAVAGIGQHAVLLGVDFAADGPSRLVCVDLATGAVTDGRTTDGWFVDAAAGPDQVYVGVRTGFAGARADGVLAVDPATCGSDPVVDDLALDPYALAWVSPP